MEKPKGEMEIKTRKGTILSVLWMRTAFAWVKNG